MTQAPGPTVQKLNALLHQEPIASIFYGLYWSTVLMATLPICIVYLQIQMIMNVITWYLQKTKSNQNNFHPNNQPEYNLAIVITGCDTGFGKNLAIYCADMGYTVFAGCYHYESSKQLFITISNIISFPLDVTKDFMVHESATLVQKWLDETDIPVSELGRKRILHALINNAGVGEFVETCYSPLQDYQTMMDVNFFGIIRMVQAFVPIFKNQLFKKEYYHTTRIVNVVSMAGLISGVPGLQGYHASKYAAQAYTDGLRNELQPFHIMVTSVNPTFHGTAITESWDTETGDRLTKKITIDSIKAQYGTSYFEGLISFARTLMTRTRWNAIVVVEQILEKCLLNPYPPKTLIIGIDGKYLTILFRMLPPSISEPLMQQEYSRLGRPKPECIIELEKKHKKKWFRL